MRMEEIKSLLGIDPEDTTNDFVISKLINPALDWCKSYVKRDFIVTTFDVDNNPIQVELVPDGVKLAVAQMVKVNLQTLSTKKDIFDNATSITFEDYTIRYKTSTDSGVTPVELPQMIKDLLHPYLDKSVKFM